jgi:Lar family restriction alleviation protein
MSDELKLLDCPFCGCEPDFLLDSDNCPYVECHSCHFAMPAYRPGFEHMAIAAWNRRTTPVSAPLDTQALPPPGLSIAHAELSARLGREAAENCRFAWRTVSRPSTSRSWSARLKN